MHELQFEPANLVKVAQGTNVIGQTIWSDTYLVLEVKAMGLVVLDSKFQKWFLLYRTHENHRIVQVQ